MSATTAGSTCCAGPVSDGADYRVTGMWLTDEEFLSFARDLNAIARPRLANTPGKGRRRRMLYSVFLPDPRQDPKA
jgi:hypothetical protein